MKKSEDINHALVRSNHVLARLASHELGVCLSHTTTVIREEADRNPLQVIGFPGEGD